jgi:hypothetical protein
LQTTADWYARFFETTNQGVTWALEEVPYLYQAILVTWALEEVPYLYQATLTELRGQLTKGELSMILDIMNGTMFFHGHGGMAGQYLRIGIQDSFDLYPGVYEDKWKTDKTKFMGKLQAMTRFQVACLELWAAGFWNQHIVGNGVDMNEWIQPLLE